MLEKLKKIALSIVDIPADFKLVIEDYSEGGDGSGEAFFSWANEKEEGIALTLDSKGHLKSLAVEKAAKDPAASPVTYEEARARAEQFLQKHYPDALQTFSLEKTEERKDGCTFSFRQIEHGAPVENSGCFIRVNAGGEITDFAYYGIKKVPDWPGELIAKEKLLNDLKTKMKFSLTIARMDPYFYDVDEAGLRLVYAPHPHFIRYKADGPEPVLLSEMEEIQEKYVPLPPIPAKGREQTSTPEELIGITETMEKLREVDLGETTGIVWRDRNWQKGDHDLSLESFLEDRTAGTVKAKFSKQTGELQGFIWFQERTGPLNLDRPACYEKAVEFLHQVIPDLYPYLQLEAGEDEWYGGDGKEFFQFRVVSSRGIPVETGSVVVAVNRTTGLIDQYMGPELDVKDLYNVPLEPAVSEEKAKEMYFSNLDFRLKWAVDYDEEEGSCRLIYEACHRGTGTAVHYIDAVTGELITARES